MPAPPSGVDRHAMLAALAEPQRLRVIDALATSDLAPGDLARRLDLSTSLLAHHLSVLEDAGAIVRRRSEGDGRRSYLALAWDQPLVAAAVAHGDPVEACRVVFVCTANSARSQFAASLFARHSDLPVASAGTAPAEQINPRALAELARHDLEPLGAAPRRLTELKREGDLIVTVCDNALESMVGDVAAHWSIPDPARASASRAEAAFAQAFTEIQPRVRRFAAALTNGRSS